MSCIITQKWGSIYGPTYNAQPPQKNIPPPKATQCISFVGIGSHTHSFACCRRNVVGRLLVVGRWIFSVIALCDLTVSYQGHPALHHISGRFERGSLTAIVGPNGSGKSTLLKSMAGLLEMDGGLVNGTIEWENPAKRIAYLPQLNAIDRHFPITVKECVLLGSWGRVGGFGEINKRALAQVTVALESVGLHGFETRALGTLSSGQLQRVLFARLLVQDAELILLDEPFNAVDTQTTAALLAMVTRWHHEKRTVVAALHDETQVLRHFPQTLILARELVDWGPSSQVLTQTNFKKTQAMSEAWDEQAEFCKRNV